MIYSARGQWNYKSAYTGGNERCDFFERFSLDKNGSIWMIWQANSGQFNASSVDFVLYILRFGMIGDGNGKFY